MTHQERFIWFHSNKFRYFTVMQSLLMIPLIAIGFVVLHDFCCAPLQLVIIAASIAWAFVCSYAVVWMFWTWGRGIVAEFDERKRLRRHS